MSNPLVAQRQSSTTWHSGINLVDDAAGLYDGVSSGSWVEGGLSAFGVGMDLLTVAMNPVGTLISYGLNWLIEHVQPLQDALNQLAGDADQIQAYSKTWGNIATAVGKAAQDLTTAVKTDTANWTGQAADAYRANLTDKIDHINAAATCASTISTVVEMVGVLTAAVRMIVRDMVTQAVGDFIQDALEEAFSLGLGTPVVVAEVVEQVSEWIEKITGVIKKLLNSVEALRPMMSKLEEIWAAIQKVMNALHGHAGGDEPHLPSDSTHPSSVDEPHTSPSGDSTTPSSADSTTPSGTDTTTPSSTDPGTSTTPSDADPTAPDSTGADPTTPSSTDPGDPGTSTTPSDSGTPSEPSTGTDAGDDGIKADNDDPPANSRSNDDTPDCGDPIDVSTGRMFLTHTDLDLPGTLPLVMSRSHRSGLRVGRWFGPHWSSTVDQRLEVEPDGVHFLAADGMFLRYPPPDVDAPVLPVHGTPWPLSRTPDGTYTVTDRMSGRTMHFADTGAARLPVTAVTDDNGNRIDVDYSPDGTLVGLRHSGGYRLAVDTADGLVTGIRLLTGGNGAGIVVARYRYDGRRRLTEVVNSSGRAMRFEYDGAGRIVRWDDRNGMWYRYVFDDAGRCVRAEGKDGFLDYRLHYDTDNLVTTATDSLGNVTTYQLNEQHQVVRQTDPLGNATVFEWDRQHRMRARTDPLGRTTRYDYDERGDLISVRRPDGGQVVTEYDAHHRPLRVTEADGSVWLRTYDGRGNLATVTDPDGATTRYGYDARGNVADITDALGKTHHIVSNAAGLPIATTDPLGGTVRYERDVFGRVVAITDEVGGVTRLQWTVEGMLRARILPDGTAERWTYDAEMNLTEYVDPLGQVTRFETSHFDLPVARIEPDGARFAFSYDTELRLVAVTDPRGLTWRYRYDAAGNLVGETDFDGRVIRYAHDAAGQVVERVNGAGQRVSYRYDALGHLVRQDSDAGTTTFGYDRLGRMVRATNADADVTFERDRLGRVVAETTNGATITSTYDPLGRRVRRRTPSGAESIWEYDANDRPTALHTAGQTIRFHHDPAGREVERQFANGASLVQTWDPAHRLHTQAVLGRPADARGNRLLQRRSYSYRPDGYCTAIVDQLSGLRRFDMDTAGRVTAVHATGWTERYAYDRTGRVTFPAANGVRYRYDRQGRVVLRQRTRLSAKPDTWHYTWDAEDRLTDLVTPDGRRWRYRYDALGRRIAKQRLDGAAVVEEVRFVWDGNVLAEQSEGIPTAARRSTTWNYEPDTFRPVGQATREAIRDTVDERFYAIVTDIVGTPTEMVDEHGDLAWQARTTLWGAPLTPTTPTPLRFPGQYFDPESGLHYNYYRYYDPATARYTSPDPLGLDGGPNPHAYVDNPGAWLDPLGLKCTRAEMRDMMKSQKIAPDLLDKGVHFNVGRMELGVHPTSDGGLVLKPVHPGMARANPAEFEAALKKGYGALEYPEFRGWLKGHAQAGLQMASQSTVQRLTGRGREFKALLKALG